MVTVTELNPYSNKKELKKFVKFPWKLYEGDPNWIPPLNLDLLGLPFMPGLLTAQHPYHEHAETKYFMVEDEEEILGRIAATVNKRHNEIHDEKTGFFGFFECINDQEISNLLFDTASEWLKEQQMEMIRGPASFTLNDICGLLIDNFDRPPYIDMPYNKRYYQKLIEGCGFEKAKDMLAFQIDLVQKRKIIDKKLETVYKIIEKKNKEGRIGVRDINLHKIKEDFRIIRKIYNEAWKDNWGHDPLTEKEFNIIASKLKMVADPHFIYIGFFDDKAVAFYGLVPNVNQLLKRNTKRLKHISNSDLSRIFRIFTQKKKIDQVRMMLFGILLEGRGKGIDAYMFAKSFKHAFEQNYKDVEISWLLEDNDMIISPTKTWGGEKYKTYRMYEKLL